MQKKACSLALSPTIIERCCLIQSVIVFFQSMNQSISFRRCYAERNIDILLSEMKRQLSKWYLFSEVANRREEGVLFRSQSSAGGFRVRARELQPGALCPRLSWNSQQIRSRRYGKQLVIFLFERRKRAAFQEK